jgi:esterase/lipase superfamily enzyme
LTLGMVKVIVPPPRSASKSGLDMRPVLDLDVSDVRQLAIQTVQLVAADRLVRTARQRALDARAYLGQALVFVHGYNTSFDNAIRRAGQLAYDLKFDGPVFLFSWPSRERLLSYITDGDSARLSAPRAVSA